LLGSFFWLIYFDTAGPVAASKPSWGNSASSASVCTPYAITVILKVCAILHNPLSNSWLPVCWSTARMLNTLDFGTSVLQPRGGIR